MIVTHAPYLLKASKALMFSQPESSPSQFDRAAHCRKIASAGGRQTVARHGRAHMSQIGRRGWNVVTARYFLGSDLLHRRWLATAAAFNYWQMTGLTMKTGPDGAPIWPDRLPVHPAKAATPPAPGQPSLFERCALAAIETLPF